MNIRFSFCFALLALLSVKGMAQGMPIGYWKAHMPYNTAVSIATDGITIFAGSNESFFTYNAAGDEISTYSKVEGMSDVGLSYIGYDAVSGYAIIAYTNGNIDLFRDETFYNIPDIKVETVSPKRINHIYTEKGMAYLSTSFGIVVLNLAKKETKETYSFTSNSQIIEVREFIGSGNYFYAVTSNGLYKANKNSPNLQAFSSWQRIDSSTRLNSVTSFDSKVYVSDPDSLYVVSNDSLLPVYGTSYGIKHLDRALNGIFINETSPGMVKILNAVTYQVYDSVRVYGIPANTIALSDNSVWVADIYHGLGRKNESELSYHVPNGPSSSGAFDILPYNGDVWVAHGGYDATWTYRGNGSGLSHLKDGKWSIYSKETFRFFKDNDVTDFITLAKDPLTGDLYAGSYRSGLFVLKQDGSYEYHKYGSPYIEHNSVDTGSYRVAGLTFDQNNNLWINNAGAAHEISVKTKEGAGYKYSGGGAFFYSAYVLTDDYNQKWYILPSGGDGVAVYNDNYTPDNPADDIYAKIVTSRYGLNSVVNCIVKDKQNAIWIGTNDGIGIINCSPDQVAAGACEIRKPIVQYDQFAGYLFQNQTVKSIAVDGANRKWVGTVDGVWLISPEGDKIIYRFTTENSPLPSDAIQKISVDPVTGDVYIGTNAGMVSYRSTATDGGTVNENVITFPNPVPGGYSGTIAIRGLAENSDVRITDISGQLIYRTKAFGGQAVWSGRDYTGRRPQSGVYLIFVTNKDGSQTHTGKMVFME